MNLRMEPCPGYTPKQDASGAMIIDPNANSCTLGGNIVKGFLSDQFNEFIDDLKAGLASLSKQLMTFWVSVPSPTLGDDSGGLSDPVYFLQSSLAWYTFGLLMMSIVVVGIKLCLDWRMLPARLLFRQLVTWIFISFAGVACLSVFLTAGDAFSAWIIEKSTEGTSFNDTLFNMIAGPAASATGSGFLTILFLIVAALCALAQAVLMIFRGATMFVIAGTLPLAASFIVTETGEKMLMKQVAWGISFCLYKPAAAIVYSMGFRLFGSDPNSADGTWNIIYGIALLLLGVFTLPAIMRLVTPAVAAHTGGKGAGSTAMTAAAMAVPMAAAGARR